MKNIIRQLVESGVRESDDASGRRSIIFSNYIALIFCMVNIPLFLAIPQNRTFSELDNAIISLSIFVLPILLNRLSLTGVSKLYLCWVPPLLVTWIMVSGMMSASTVPVSTYYGLRIYLVAMGCIPYLLLDRKHLAMFILGVVPALFILTFFDYCLRLLGVPIESLGQGMTPMRSFIAYAVVGGSCFALRYVVDSTDLKNQKLIIELEQKNKIIQDQAESEVSQLNQQLRLNLDALTKREEVLKKSQGIAKVGSWELDLDSMKTYWSDQVYDIFGVHKDFDLNSPMLTRTLFNESGQVIENALQELIATGKTYDFTLKARTPLGYVKWVRVFGFPLYTGDKMTGVSGIVHDVTFFKESEERARANAKNYQSLFEQASDAIVVNDFNGNIIDANSAMTKLIGYPKAELLKMKIVDIQDQVEIAKRPIDMSRLSMGEQIFVARVLKRKDNELVHVEVNAKMIGENKIMGIV
ncbi:MAG TPA: PAS domain-containing protein, partial [Cyclobacteriaceae bacterium]|nr:PAS domain-containing protein [Cyclobacteriaceae bacterium]